jgi:hypothetical protein
MAVAFADVMGPGSSHGLLVRDTAHLVTALFRLSSVLIFNWMGRFHVDAILQTLGLFTCRVNRLQAENGRGRRLCFLHVVLRDINQTTLDDSKMRNLLLGEEPTSNPGVVDPGSVERNEIRAILNAAFSKIFVWTMPFPFSETDSTQTSPLFTKKIHNLRKSLAFQINQQSDHGLEALTGSSIADKLPSLLNSTAASSISAQYCQSSFSANQVAVAMEAICLYQTQLSKATNDLKLRYPMPEDDVSQRLSEEESHLRNHLHNTMCCITSSQSRLHQSIDAEADRLYSSHLCNALEDNRQHQKRTAEAKLLQARATEAVVVQVKDQIVWRLLKECHEGAKMEINGMPEKNANCFFMSLARRARSSASNGRTNSV